MAEGDSPTGGRAATLRARVRAEMTEEIKHAARRQLAADGANLSLRAIARDLGMVSSALYRYFASRDDLLTALIIDAYNGLGEATERGEAAAPREDLAGRWLAAGHAIRDWAVANPHEYALIYGSPVPGYIAPRDTVGPASRPTIVLGAILVDGFAAGVFRTRPGETAPAPLSEDMDRLIALVAPGVPTPIVVRGLIAWTEIFGAINFELFGRFNNVIEDLSTWYDHQLHELHRLVLGFNAGGVSGSVVGGPL
jgi:AcrR family transcriptional regulator